MARENATSIDVARRAGVSQSAVSRVVTPGASASRQTVEKVRKAANELGYRPNSLARAMVSGKSRIIGLVVAYLQNQFYPEALEKLSNELQERGYHVLVFLAAHTAGNVDDVLDEILDYQVDGIIAASVALSSDLSNRCHTAGVPTVMFNRSQDDLAISAVTSDNYAGGRKVAEFLIAGGHERIAFMAGWEGASTQRDREAGFRDGLQDAGVPLFARGVGNFEFDQARNATRQMFSGDRDTWPNALFVANDHMAFAVMDVLRSELRLTIPNDVSIIGFDDVPPASWAAYNLTTLRQRSNLMVDQTVRLMIDKIRDPKVASKHIKIASPLIVRGSAKIPKGWI